MERHFQRSSRPSTRVSMPNDQALVAMHVLKKQGKCLHMLSGNISYGLCSRGYSCTRCSFDQMMEDAGYLQN